MSCTCRPDFKKLANPKRSFQEADKTILGQVPTIAITPVSDGRRGAGAYSRNVTVPSELNCGEVTRCSTGMLSCADTVKDAARQNIATARTFVLKENMVYLPFGWVISIVSRRTSSSMGLIEIVCSPAARPSAV